MGLGAARLPPVKQRQWHGEGRAKRPIAIALGIQTGSTAFEKSQSGKCSTVLERGQLPAVGLDFRALTESCSQPIRFRSDGGSDRQRCGLLPISVTGWLAEQTSERKLFLC